MYTPAKPRNPHSFVILGCLCREDNYDGKVEVEEIICNQVSVFSQALRTMVVAGAFRWSEFLVRSNVHKTDVIWARQLRIEQRR